MKGFRVWLLLGLISACSDSNSPPDGGGNDASNDTTTGQDAANDVTQGVYAPVDSPADSPIPDASKDAKADASDAGDGGTLFTLTINDYINWCAVSVNGGQPSTADPQTFQFAPDASVSLHGDTASSQSFYWGYWQAAGLGDGGKVTNMDVSFNMNGNVNILACCPINNTALSCP